MKSTRLMTFGIEQLFIGGLCEQGMFIETSICDGIKHGVRNVGVL